MLNITAVSLKRDQITLFEDLNLTVHPGQKVAVVGRNGVGKSTLFDLILGRLQSDTGEITRPRGWRISHMAQEVVESDRIAEEYVIDGDKELRRAERKLASAEADGNDMAIATAHGSLDDAGAYQAHARAGEILFGLGFSAEDTTRGFSEFSGGWRIRLNLAQALMWPTELLLLDEPTNHLDLEATLWLETWLQRYPGTLLVIAHDREFLDNVVDHTAHLTDHKANTYRGNYSSFERQRAQALVLQQAAFTRQQREIAHIESFVRRFRAKATKARQAQSRLKALEKMEAVAPVHAESPYHIDFPNPVRMSNPLLSLNRMSIGYNGQPVLTNVHETILPGARIGVLGENGAGKSTLLKSLVGDLEPMAGELARGQHSSVGYFAQHQLETLNQDTSALTHVQRQHTDQREQWCRNYLGTWGFSIDKIERKVATLSGGEKARLVLSLIAAQRPTILVLDEPTNHLDLDMRDALALALQDFTGALVIVAHDRSLLSRTVNEFWLVEGGRVHRLDSDLTAYALEHNPARVARELSNSQPATLNPTNSSGGSRKSQRRAAAEKRQKEKPVRESIRKLESRIDTLNRSLAEVETRLADPELYNTLPPEELDELLRQAGKLRKKRDDAETRWLTACEELEGLENGR